MTNGPHEHGAFFTALSASDGRQRCSLRGTGLAPALCMLWEEEIPGGAHWSGVLRRGVVLRLIAGGADANVAALFFSRELDGTTYPEALV